jgi:hypothetical protein
MTATTTNGSVHSAILEAALKYRKRGWSVAACCPPDHAGMGDWHNCESPGKRPWHAWKDLKETPATEEQIKEWWRQQPRSNVGIFLGPVSGLIRVDVDGDAGAELLRQKSGGDLPPTLEFTSNGSGLGMLYAIPPSCELRTTSAKGDGDHNELRFQAKGAQTVLPPSVHPKGGIYQWKPGHSPDDIEPALAPDWLIRELSPSKHSKPGARIPSNSNSAIGTSHHCYPNIEVARMAVAALGAPRASDYDEWIDVGMALQSVDDSLLAEWIQFSRACPDKFREGECEQKWRSFTRGGGVTLGTLVKMAEDDGWLPPWKQRGSSWSTGSVLRAGDEICNAIVTKTDKQKHIDPLPMGEIIRRAKTRCGDWPRRMASVLFVHHGDAIGFIEKPPALFGYFGGICGEPPRFITNPECHTKPEVFEEFRRTATAYDAIERSPHEPVLPGHYYACPILEPGDGEHLRELVGRFNPATPIDGDLITALFATLVWGGAGGRRPAFCVTSDDGRGAGKTALVNAAGYLVGGTLEVVANEDAARIKTRLLSPEGLLKRVVLLDNAKTRCLSWADLEGMITSPVISGHRLFTGEMVRPNVITWCITMNGGSYSTDLAQRSVFIKVAKPKYAGTWEESLREFIDQNRQAIFADLVRFLRGPRFELSKFTRWGAWERDVLSRLPEPSEAQAVIIERQQAADAEVEESEVIGDYFRSRIETAGYSVDFARVFIPSNTARDWLAVSTGEKFTTIAASRTLGQFIDEGKLVNLERNKSRAMGRGFVWLGENWSPDDPIRGDLESRLVAGEGRFPNG